MNRPECDVLRVLLTQPYENQRELAEKTGHSLGIVNRSLHQLVCNGYLGPDRNPTPKARAFAKKCAPQHAVILAAGLGKRMVPIHTEQPKALLEVFGEPLIERIIRQLHEVGISQIDVVVGYQKEKFEYLIDDFGVQLVVNPEYASKNNLHSLNLVREQLFNTYVVPCDIWCKENPFRRFELYSWYMISDTPSDGGTIRVNRRMELVPGNASGTGNLPLGIAYLTQDRVWDVRKQIQKTDADPGWNSTSWEDALFQNKQLTMHARLAASTDIYEINTYEALCALDPRSHHLKSDAIAAITTALHVSANDISHITMLKKGTTNRSFSFICRGKKYIMRIPGPSTDQPVNRYEEAAVYRALNGQSFCEEVLFFDPENGYKITAFLDVTGTCDAQKEEDVSLCMRKLREFHELNLSVDHEFDIFRQIDFYESLWSEPNSVYRDYSDTKKQIWSLRPFIQAHAAPRVLTHIDPVPDNFLFARNANGELQVHLIDWEYAGMQDPHVDLAMFCIYALYDRTQVDRLIDLYFPEGCNTVTRIKIYCYIAACGLLWSNWCEYKRGHGVEFGAYSIAQYRYAKEYFRIAQKEIQKIQSN